MPEQIFRPSFPSSGRVTPAAFPFYTTGEDNFRLTSYNAAAGVHLQLVGRLIDASGNVASTRWDHTPNTDRSAKSDDYPLSGSTLLNIAVVVSAGTPVIGQTFVIVQLIRGTGPAALVLGTVLSGYVSPGATLGWPGSPLQSAVDGGGYYRTVFGTAPAAGAHWSQVVPTGARWDVLSLHVDLTTSGTAGQRFPMFGLQRGAGLSYLTWTDVTCTALELVTIIGGQSPRLGSIAPGGQPYLSLPLPSPCILIAGDSLVDATVGLLVNDQFSVPIITLREWLEP